MNTTITINAKNHTIEMNKTFAKNAAIFGTDEYKQLQEARRDYPNYRVTTIRQKAGKGEFKGLDYDFMDKYVADHDESGALTAEYRILRGLDGEGIAEDYSVIKDWFLNTFPAFEQARKERLELLAKIKREKEARLAARKAA